MNRKFWLRFIAFFIMISVFLSTTVFAGAPEAGFSVEETRTTVDKGLNSEVEKEVSSQTSTSTFVLNTEISSVDLETLDIMNYLGSELTNQIERTSSTIVVQNTKTNQIYTRYELTNGGSIGINESGIVNINNYEPDRNIPQENDLNSVIDAISSSLSLDDYIVTEAGVSESCAAYTRVVWKKEVSDGIYNPYDSVWVVLDSDTYQILYLDRYNLSANAITPQITEQEAIAIAEEYSMSDYSDVRLTYVRPNTNVGGSVPNLLFETRLSYVLYGDNQRVTVDALNGNIIGYAEAAKAARVFGCTDTMLANSAAKMSLARPKLIALGYTMSSNYTLNTTSSNTDFINFLNGSNNYGLYISCHASSSVLTNNKTDDESRYFRVESTSVPSGSLWNFVFLDACETANGTTWSNAFGITNSSNNKAFIGFNGSAYTDDTYAFGQYFWSKVGTKSISECVEYGVTAPGCDDLYAVFRGDADYNGDVS